MVIGIGIGMIITSIINIVFINEKTNYINEINNSPFIKIPYKDQNEETNDLNKIDINQSINGNNTSNSERDIEREYKEIFIQKGMDSEEIAYLLQKNEIINNADDFIDIVNKLDVANQLKYGLKKIPNNSTLQDILEILVRIH